MGNCIRTQSANPWDGDDSSDECNFDDVLRSESIALINRWRLAGDGQTKTIDDDGDYGLGVMNGGRVAATEVKIRLTKKQLEELVNVVDMQGLSLEQLLKKAAGLGSVDSVLRHRHWRPALQSIPEVE